MENAHLKEMSRYELFQTLQATVATDGFEDEFTEAYAEVLRRAKETHDLRHLKKCQDLRWRQTEFLVQSWLKYYPKTTHDARVAGC